MTSVLPVFHVEITQSTRSEISENATRTETCCPSNVCSQGYLAVMPVRTVSSRQRNCPVFPKSFPTTTSFFSYTCTRVCTSLIVLACSTCYLRLLPADPDTCATSSPCVNGNCENTGPGSFVCSCYVGWTGTLCEQCKNPVCCNRMSISIHHYSGISHEHCSMAFSNATLFFRFSPGP